MMTESTADGKTKEGSEEVLWNFNQGKYFNDDDDEDDDDNQDNSDDRSCSTNNGNDDRRTWPNSINSDNSKPRCIRTKFIWFCIFFSINHAAGLSCISLAAIQFQQQKQQQQEKQSTSSYQNDPNVIAGTVANINGTAACYETNNSTATTTENRKFRHDHIASYQNSMIYTAYTITALLGIPRYVNRYMFHQNTKYAVVMGMYLFTLYVLCFWIAILLYPKEVNGGNDDRAGMISICDGIVYFGAIMGGIGAAIATSNQGIYYTQIVKQYYAVPTMTLPPPPDQQLQHQPAKRMPLPPQDQIYVSPSLFWGHDKSGGDDLNATHMPSVTSDAVATVDIVYNDVDGQNNIDDSLDSNNEGVDANTGIIKETCPLRQQLQQFASIFAFCLLFIETLWNCITTLFIHYLQWNWHGIFALYTILSFVSTILLQFYCTNVTELQSTTKDLADDCCAIDTSISTADSNDIIIINTKHHHRFLYIFYDTVSSTVRLFVSDSKVKYLFGYTSAFALSSVYLNIFITGEVVVQSIPHSNSYWNDNSNNTAYEISYLVTCHGLFAAISAFGFGRIAMFPHQCCISTWCCRCCHYCYTTSFITIFGAIVFACIAIPFLFHPSIADWSFATLAILYSLQGIGRATFEGTFKAMIADYFPKNHEKDAAFANIVFQHGLVSALAYGLVDHFTCSSYGTDKIINTSVAPSRSKVYCVQYHDGTYHNILILSWILIGSCIIAITGLLRSAYLNTTTPSDSAAYKISNYKTVTLPELE